MPDFELIEWNESNIDITAHPYMERMHSEGKYSFASDYARLAVLHEHGGIYLDTDVLMKKSLAPFCGTGTFWSFEFDHFISTCIIGSVPGHPLLQGLLKEYDGLEHEVINNTIVTKHILLNYPEFHLNNKEQVIGGDIRILPKEYFVVPSFRSDRNYAVHNANNHWRKQRKRSLTGRVIEALIGEVLFYKLINIKLGWGHELKALERERNRAVRRG